MTARLIRVAWAVVGAPFMLVGLFVIASIGLLPVIAFAYTLEEQTWPLYWRIPAAFGVALGLIACPFIGGLCWEQAERDNSHLKDTR